MDDSEDEVMEVEGSTYVEEVKAKLQEIRSCVPFIQRVQTLYQQNLSKVQGQRLDALVRLLERENVSMNTLSKIEQIIGKLRTKFEPRLQPTVKEIIDISDHTEIESVSSTSSNQSSIATHPPAKQPQPSKGIKSSGSLIPSSAATKSKPAPPKAPEPGPSAKASASGSNSFTKTLGSSDATKTSGSLPTLKAPGFLTTPKTSDSLAIPKISSAKPTNEVQKPRDSEPSVSAQVRDTGPPAIPQTVPAAQKKKPELVSNPLNRGVLAAMHEARMEEKKQRANAQQTTSSPSTKESSAAAPPETEFLRRSYPGSAAKATPSPQFTHHLPANLGPSHKQDFVRRSSPLVLPVPPTVPLPVPLQEASPRLCGKDAGQPLSCKEAPAQATPSIPSPTNTLKEARRKLAALKEGAITLMGQEMPPLSSNINDPRGKKNLSLPKLSINNNNNESLTPVTPPTVRSPSPIPPPPSMRSGTWHPYSNIPLEGSGFNAPQQYNSDSPGGVRTYGAGVAREPSHEPRRLNGTESREQRDPRIWQNKPAHSHQQPQQTQQPQQPSPQQPQVLPYFSDPRRASTIYNDYDEANGWQSGNPNNSQNVNGNGTGNAYNKSSWRGSHKVSGPNARGFMGNQNGSGNAGGFNGSSSFRGGYRGGHNPRGGGGNQNSRFDRSKDIPRTYKEHRKAKARAEAEAKAKAAEKQRQLDADTQRELDAEEKQRKLLAAENQRKLEESQAATAAPVTPVPELDTSYRNCTLGLLTKKLDFRIPKKTPPVATTTPNSVNLDGDNLSCSSNSPTSKSCDAKKDRDKNKDTQLDKTKDKEKVEKGNDKLENNVDKSSKHHKSQDKKSDKEKSRSGKKARKQLDRENEKKSGDTESVNSVDSSENTDNLENEPPVSETNASPLPELPLSTPDSQQAQPPVDELEIIAKIGGPAAESTTSTSKATISATFSIEQDDDGDLFDILNKIKGPTGTKAPRKRGVSTSEATSTNANLGKPEEKDDKVKVDAEGKDEHPPKLSKMKIIVGPNATLMVLNDEKNKKPSERFEDEHDDEEVPGPSLQLLHRIMQRRNSMAPTASKPLVNKEEISTSLLYEDLQEQRRKSQNARSLANMFEKTNDNCSVSTQNIISGKRRTRGLEASFNETDLSRSIFGLGQINRSRAKADDGGTSRAKTPAPGAAKSTESSLKVDAIEVAPVAAPNRKRRRQTIHVETADNSVEPKRACLETKEINEVRDTTDKQPAENSMHAHIMDVDENSAESVPQSVIPPPPKPRAKPRKKRNELDKLNDDIAQMYYGDDVLRATGRRACTRRSRTPSQTRSSSQRSRTPSLARASPTPDSISSPSMASPIFIRNVARRGKAFTPGSRSFNSGINRTTFKASLLKTKSCRVRIKRCPALEELTKKLNQQPETEQIKTSKERKVKKNVCNINPEWHSKSKANIKCVVCLKPIRRSSVCHYMMYHKEHFAARLPPGVLDELRAGRGNRPDYWILQRSYKVFHFKCPFCEKLLLLGQQNLGDHLNSHLGEPRQQCSHCNFPQSHQSKIHMHTASCGPGAKALSNPNNGRLPMKVHVCHLCQFVQQNKENMDRHLVEQHGLTKEQLESVGREEVVLCTTADVPSEESKNKTIVNQERNEDDTAKPSESPKANVPISSKAATKGVQKKKVKIRFKKMAKKSARRVKREREEEETQAADMEVDPELPELPQPPPEKEPVLVINECLMDIEMDADLEEGLDEEQALQNKSLMVDEKPVVLLDVVAEQVEPEPIEQEPIEQEPTEQDPTEPEPSPMEEDLVVKEVTPPHRPPVQHSAHKLPEVSLAELAVLDGIGSDGSDVEIEDEPLSQQTAGNDSAAVEPNDDGDGNGENVNDDDEDDDDNDGAVTDEWVDLETAKRNSKGSKSIFHVFNRFCSRIRKGTRSGKPVASIASSSSDSSNDVPDPSELMPRMRPLEPEPAPVPKKVKATPVSATPEAAAVTPTRLLSPPKQVENVAFRKSSSDGEQHRQASYFCMRPGCTFLFSNELEGLENHFALEHPQVRWSGRCAICPGISAMGTNLSISGELRHMRDEHMVDRPALPPQPPTVVEVEVPPAIVPDPEPVPVLPKLRVRRFTGDRLNNPAAEEPSNEMLRVLLAAEPRPPNQQVDFNAVGLGEFLCAKPNTPPTELAVEQPVIINYQSGLGLAISQVYSGAQMAGDAVPSLVVGETHSELSAASVAVEGNRFRCMANNCNFSAHKVMFVREHMKFHSFSFRSTDYLNCAYCSHVAVDVDDYLRHGVFIHDLAPRSDLDSVTGPPSVSQLIRDKLSQRGNAANIARLPAAIPAVQPVNVQNCVPATGGSGVAAPPTGPVTLTDAVTDLLRPTGYSEDRLFACPQKGCIVRLTEEQFVNHVRYHVRDQVKCKYCSQMMLPPALRTHLQQTHARHSIFCAICLATAVNKRLMLYHMRNEHGEAFDLVNRQLQFIQLQTMPDGVAKEGVEADWYVAALEQPFGEQQMQSFQRKLFEELDLRRQGTKTVFRGSEVRLLPRVQNFPGGLRCGECPFVTSDRPTMQQHLYKHKEEAIYQAYQSEELAVMPGADSASPTADSATVAEEPIAPGTSGQSSQPEPPQPDPIVPGVHKPIRPPFEYVPSRNRYRCGFAKCGTVLSSERVLRQHMSSEHKYSEMISCQHCKTRQTGQASVEKYLAHLLMHKRHIFQCGACERYNNKRVAIERHIQDRHYNQNVDVVVHRHGDDGTISARWLKTPKLLRLPQMEFTCNLCMQCFPTDVQNMAHAASVHNRNYQYHCPYCPFGDKTATMIIDHILCTHPGLRVQPMQIFQRIVTKNKQLLGFYCSFCHESASNFQKIAVHSEERHKSRFMFQCPHCEVGHQNERNVVGHILKMHPEKSGLAVMQFERVVNEMPDSVSWEMGQPIEVELEQQQVPGQGHSREMGGRKVQVPQIVMEVVDLLASDEEAEEGEADMEMESDEPKIVEFACTHCDETNSNLQDLRAKHWARHHPDQPFYFRVQPQLLCSECKMFKGNAKVLRDEHLVKVHSIRNIVAADIRRPGECAYCDYRYRDWQDLANHINRLGHLPNDLKQVTDAELDALKQLCASGNGSAVNEYYQCDLCSMVMPTKVAIGHHGRMEHNKPGEPFCFRQLKAPVIYHCFFCMFTSSDELTTLRHMVDHYSRFRYCHFCTRHQKGGFEEYIQHCYTFHRDDVHRFRAVHSYNDLRKFLMQVHYQFQNGLIITKSSLRYTRYNDESMMRKLDEELMAKAQQPPIPRLHIRLKSTGVAGQTQVEIQAHPAVMLGRIAKRRKTLNPDELLRISRQEEPAQQRQLAQAGREVARSSALNNVLSTSSAAATPPLRAPATTTGNFLGLTKRRNSYVVRTGP
ncbi:uncharacterized protein LOC108040107 [Drosophila rhopaloa]|uniref:Uncharacterized protein LOC108040107 n=1 Tax=Drosophila rhopaloa TaxID=1041015 RepID=A0A6P4E4L5_DRORH|nr:uncharacterized protein LOC108040107 [Drosophila rhopaloa]XP_016972852.1 uncharacterized protein LOC108040107 [Drosophila rhopaloa]XP_016972853.1 uncharacterized protein LOC108040107 [Drosophila rhopaloa]